MIRQVIILFLLLVYMSACSQSSQKSEGISNSVNQKNDSVSINQDETTGPLINFELQFKDLGEVEQNSRLTYEYEFTNTGSEALIITNVRTSCSCSVASYSKTPIAIGNSDIIILKLDTKILGQFTKSIAVYSNAINHFADDIGQSRVILKIKWVVTEEIK